MTCYLIIIIAVIFTLKLYIKLRTRWDRSPTCLVGKTTIVTGANSGIGYYTALDFAKRGAKVILACRDLTRANEAKRRIISATGNTNIIVRLVDLESFQSIRQFAKNIKDTEEKLDILVNNAGSSAVEQTLTKDGLSLSMQVNHFGPFLLTILLLDVLKKSTRACIVNVSSDMVRAVNVNLGNLNTIHTGWFKQIRDYAHAKLCHLLVTNELARKMKGTGISVNSLHPGSVQTGFLRYYPYFKKIIWTIIVKSFFKPTEAGAQTSIYVAVSNEVVGISGGYFSECKKCCMPKSAKDEQLAKMIWKKSVELIKLTADEEQLYNTHFDVES